MKIRDPIWRRKKKAGFDQSRLADECIQLKVANGKAWEINESEFLQLEKGKMRFMMWRHRAESCSITRFTINLNKEETAPPVAATLYWYTYFSLEPSTFQAGSPALLLLPALLHKDTLFFSFLNTRWVTEQVYTQFTTALTRWKLNHPNLRRQWTGMHWNSLNKFSGFLSTHRIVNGKKTLIWAKLIDSSWGVQISWHSKSGDYWTCTLWHGA